MNVRFRPVRPGSAYPSPYNREKFGIAAGAAMLALFLFAAHAAILLGIVEKICR